MSDRRELDAAVRRMMAGRARPTAAVTLTHAQLVAFVALVLSILVVSLAPVVTTGVMGKTIPDSLIAVSDKTVTGLIGVLGTLVGVMWQARPRAPEHPEPASGKRGDPVHTIEEEPA